MKITLTSTCEGGAATAVMCRPGGFTIRQGFGESRHSIVILTRAEAVELVEVIADQLAQEAAVQLRATADRLHDAADRIEGTALTELVKDITT